MRPSTSSPKGQRERLFGPGRPQASPARSLAVLAAGLTAGALAQDLRAEEEIPFSDARIIIETNASDCDTGIQIIFDGEPWTRVKVEDPNGRLIFDIRTRASLAAFGLTEQRNESHEPPMQELVALDEDCDEAEFSLAEFQELFPEGIYEFEGETVEGQELESVTMFSHVIPAAPEILVPMEDAVVDPDVSLFVDWEPVTEPIETLPLVPGLGPVNIVRYQVLVLEDVDMPPVFSIDLLVEDPAVDVTQVTVPEEFLEPGREYKLEVLAIDQTGNQTITESAFVTAD